MAGSIPWRGVDDDRDTVMLCDHELPLRERESAKCLADLGRGDRRTDDAEIRDPQRDVQPSARGRRPRRNHDRAVENDRLVARPSLPLRISALVGHQRDEFLQQRSDALHLPMQRHVRATRAASLGHQAHGLAQWDVATNVQHHEAHHQLRVVELRVRVLDHQPMSLGGPHLLSRREAVRLRPRDHRPATAERKHREVTARARRWDHRREDLGRAREGRQRGDDACTPPRRQDGSKGGVTGANRGSVAAVPRITPHSHQGHDGGPPASRAAAEVLALLAEIS